MGIVFAGMQVEGARRRRLVNVNEYVHITNVGYIDPMLFLTEESISKYLSISEPPLCSRFWVCPLHNQLCHCFLVLSNHLCKENASADIQPPYRMAADYAISWLHTAISDLCNIGESWGNRCKKTKKFKLRCICVYK
jgi:hypothetical protein